MSTSKKSYTLSIRLTADEYQRLLKESAGLSFSEYGRNCLFGDAVQKRRTRGKHPVKDHALLSRVLAKLGATRISNNLNQLAHVANCGALILNPELQTILVEAYAEIQDIKSMIISALGLEP